MPSPDSWKATNPQTGDHIVITATGVAGSARYSLNYGPELPVPGHLVGRTYAEIARALLETVRAYCAPCHAEELTLP